MQFEHQAVGRVIRELRIKRHMSQDVVSGLAGIARTHLTMIESGSKEPNLETVWRIALALDMKPSELIVCVEESISARAVTRRPDGEK